MDVVKYVIVVIGIESKESNEICGWICASTFARIVSM